MTVAGVTRLHARRLEVGRGGTRSPLGLLDVAPVLGRSTGTGRLAGEVPAVLQAGEDAEGVGVGRTRGGLAVAGDLSGAGGRHAGEGEGRRGGKP